MSVFVLEIEIRSYRNQPYRQDSDTSFHPLYPQKTTYDFTKSNGTLGYIHRTGERSITRLPVVCLELRPIWVACLSLGLLDSALQYALFRSVGVRYMFEKFCSQHFRYKGPKRIRFVSINIM